MRVVKSWPCKREQDTKATRYAMTFQGLQEEKEGSETFRTQDIDAVVNYLDQFFNMATDKGT